MDFIFKKIIIEFTYDWFKIDPVSIIIINYLTQQKLNSPQEIHTK